MPLRLLVVEGNQLTDRERHRDEWGLTPADSYAAVLKALAPDAECDVVYPADAAGHLPAGTELSAYDGAVLTGSALHVWRGGPEVERQIAFMRALYAARVPTFGSCWGLQIGAAAAGGDVRRNPAGREVGFARNIAVTEAGRGHSMLTGRPASFSAPAVHLDAVVVPPADCSILARNALTPIQAAEIRFLGGTFWGVQYHPEFSLSELAAILRRIAPAMVDEGFGRSVQDLRDHADELALLDGDRSRRDLAWKHGIDEAILDDERRLTEIRNFLDHAVRPAKSRRGRA